MTLQSMTGFARNEGSCGRYRWTWEIRSVNGKGLDIRLRLPQGLEGLESDVKGVIGRHISRGNLQVALSLSTSDNRMEAVVNEDALNAVLALRKRLGTDVVDNSPLSLDGLLSIRGLVDFREVEDDADAIKARQQAIMAGLEETTAQLTEMRQREGAALKAVLLDQVSKIEQLTLTVEQDPSRGTDEILKKLTSQVAALMASAPTLDKDRLYAEAALLATKADLREEIDRLKAHVSAARQLLAGHVPVGRKLDFLAQEFNRESNTICSKSNAAAVTAAGIELKVVIDQFREQVQNLE
ncbi:YicC/YloC family endoribonuclease [Allorhizobium terrae]|uniref:YicC family protein n=1 Tax=Allorhizobium terrae TaxID=1848972 RepID=A0A4V3W8T0_9HYPH|nr:YicC/YloC family endoribonuclease [Allorhizobium terrae]THF52433.1 YicC family protein [Allorhizobium terrae]TWD57336.1 uncharacterized protein (TIGR00255 family) [Agrobacterium vitis]